MFQVIARAGYIQVNLLQYLTISLNHFLTLPLSTSLSHLSFNKIRPINGGIIVLLLDFF